MSELVKRELTLHDASRIANHPARTEPIRQYRDYQIISALVHSGKGTQFEPFFREELLRAMAKGPEDMVGNILIDILKVPAIDVSDLVVQCTGSSWYATSMALHYLEAKATHGRCTRPSRS